MVWNGLGTWVSNENQEQKPKKIQSFSYISLRTEEQHLHSYKEETQQKYLIQKQLTINKPDISMREKRKKVISKNERRKEDDDEKKRMRVIMIQIYN